MTPPKVGDQIVSIDKSPEYDGRIGTVLAVEMKENRGKTEARIHVQWAGRRNKTWITVASQGERWRLDSSPAKACAGCQGPVGKEHEYCWACTRAAMRGVR